MKDQAERLREIIDNIKSRQAASQDDLISKIAGRNSRVITVTSGKGGVGKTNITVNLAIALSEMGLRVTILDADFGLANVDVILGLNPKYSLVDVIHSSRNILEILAEGPMNIKFLSGGSGVEELVKLDENQLKKFITNISLLDRISDIILIDTGAGLSENVMTFVMAADEVILVTTPEPTSITDAYALIKMVASRDKSKTIKLIVNKAENIGEAEDILRKLTIVTEKFLKIKIFPLGFVFNDESVIKAVKRQQPFSLSFPKSYASKHIKDISKKLLELDENVSTTKYSGIKGFVSRLVGTAAKR